MPQQLVSAADIDCYRAIIKEPIGVRRPPDCKTARKSTGGQLFCRVGPVRLVCLPFQRSNAAAVSGSVLEQDEKLIGAVVAMSFDLVGAKWRCRLWVGSWPVGLGGVSTWTRLGNISHRALLLALKQKILAYSIAYGVPVILSVMGLWLTSVAGRHLR